MWIMTCWLRTTSRVRTYGDAAIVTYLSTGEKAVNRFPSALWACHPGIKRSPLRLANCLRFRLQAKRIELVEG